MLNFTWNRHPIKHLLINTLFISLVESIYLNTDASEVKVSLLYSILLNECRDIVSQPQVSMFIRYAGNDEISKDLLFCKALHFHTGGEDIIQFPEVGSSELL